MSTDDKVVQTELSPDEYDRIRRVADREDKSLKETLRDAAVEYARSHSALDAADPFFAYDPDGSTGDSLSAHETDEYLYDE